LTRGEVLVALVDCDIRKVIRLGCWSVDISNCVSSKPTIYKIEVCTRGSLHSKLRC
jgi:hypothetical protein